MIPKSGAFLALALIFFSVLPAGAEVPGEKDSQRELKVLICLDGVPFSMMNELRGEGKFPSFNRPAKLLSTFPAITEVMLGAFYHAEPPPGYGLRYYDREKNELVGGLGDQEAISIWNNVYDYLTPMIDRGITYLWGRWGHADLNYVRHLLETTDSGVLLMHLDSTDALMHHEKPYVTKNLLGDFSELLEEFLAKRSGEKIEVVLFSDHGNEMVPTKRIPIESWLKKKGFLPAGTIKGDSGVAILPTGLISTGYMYTPKEAAVAEALIGMPGLEFSIYESNGDVHVLSDSGRAVINRNSDGRRFRYRTVTGDPFKLMPIAERLTAEGKSDAEGYIADEEWRLATIDHAYPDAVNRAYGGVTGHVVQVGDVLFSLLPGWHSGSKFLSYTVHFEGTHGSLRADSIHGFILSSNRAVPDLRAEDALEHLGWGKAIAEKVARKGVKLDF